MSLTISVLENENAKKSAQITLLNTKISLYEKRLSQTRSANTDLTTRSMNQNIVFSCNEKQLSTAEGQEDDCVSIVKDLIQNKLKTTGIQVVRAHRLGSSNASRSAPIVARLASREQVAAVLKNGKELKGTGIYVNPQLPAEVRERRQFAHEEFKTARDKPGVTARMAGDKLYLNNELQRQFLPPNIPDTLIDSLDTPPLSSSDIKSNGKSKMQAFSGTVRSIDDVRPGYDTAIAQCMPTPDNVIYAYHLRMLVAIFVRTLTQQAKLDSVTVYYALCKPRRS